jgi:hypothetical protein
MRGAIPEAHGGSPNGVVAEAAVVQRARNADALQRVSRGDAVASTILPLVVNCVADILQAEGHARPLSLRQRFQPADPAGVRSLVRVAPEGAFVLVAEKARFPLLFQLSEAVSIRSKAKVTNEQWEEAHLLALEADLAAHR